MPDTTANAALDVIKDSSDTEWISGRRGAGRVSSLCPRLNALFLRLKAR